MLGSISFSLRDLDGKRVLMKKKVKSVRNKGIKSS